MSEWPPYFPSYKLVVHKIAEIVLFLLFQLFGMIFPLVLPQSSHCLWLNVTRVAVERLGRVVVLHVSNKAVLTLKVVITLIALEGRFPLSNVISSDMTRKSLLGHAWNITYRTDKITRFLCFHMTFHKVIFCKYFSCESLWTFRTPKWPVSCVLSLVSRQIGFICCLVLAFVTGKTFRFRSVFWNTPVKAFFN